MKITESLFLLCENIATFKSQKHQWCLPYKYIPAQPLFGGCATLITNIFTLFGLVARTADWWAGGRVAVPLTWDIKTYRFVLCSQNFCETWKNTESISCEHEIFLNPELRLKPSPVNTKFLDLKPRLSCKWCSMNVYHLHQILCTPENPLQFCQRLLG